MNRRQLLHALTGMALGARPLISTASLARARDDNSVAILAIGNPGTYTVLSVLENLPAPMPNMVIGTSRVNIDHVRSDFDRAHYIDSDCLWDDDGIALVPPVCDYIWQELRVELPKERTWLIVGSLSGDTGSVLIPLIVREASQAGRRVHVFALCPSALEHKSSFQLAVRTQLEIARWTDSCVIAPNTSYIDSVSAVTPFEDYLDAIDRKCLAWVKAVRWESSTLLDARLAAEVDLTTSTEALSASAQHWLPGYRK